MTVLDVADLVVIAGRTIGVSATAALAEVDIAAAQAAFAQARAAGHRPEVEFSDHVVTAAAGIGLMRALLAHRPFPRRGEVIAVAAGLQFLSLNGWQADLDPPAATTVVIEALASGQLSQDGAVAWLSARLSPASAPAPRTRGVLEWMPIAGRRKVTGVVIALAISGFTLLATACAHLQH